MASKGERGSHARRSAGYPASASRHFEEAREGLKESAQETASHVSESAGQMKEEASEFVSGIAGQAQEAWRGAREGLQEKVSNLSARASDIWEDGVEFVQRHPLASLGVAFGIGCLTSCAVFALARSTDDVAKRMSRASS